MSENATNKKIIAKNTVVLYIRMLVMVLVSLYTSRIVLKTLGVEDYGVYNVVGGFVAMLSYLRSAFVGATQRYIAYTLGEGNYAKLKTVFSTSLSVHLILGGIIIIVAETFGLWFVNTQLEIAPSRMVAANWVYQCSIVALIFSLVSVPYNATIVAHEHMHVFAYITVSEAILKLLIVYLLIIASFDKLIFYALLHLSITIFVWLFYRIYCRKKFEESHYTLKVDKPLFKEMFSYSGWTMIGSLGFSFKDQFSNIIMNMFLGTAINAARGLAMQVNSIIISFSENIFTAIAPQITKQYAAGNQNESQSLVYSGARYTFYMLALITIPVIINIDYFLRLWLEEVPAYTSEFIVITLLSSIVYSLTKPLTTALQATGEIKAFQIGIAIIMLMELPLAWLFLKLEYKPYIALMPAIFTNAFGILYRFYLLKKMIPSYSFRIYMFDICLKCVGIFTLCYVVSKVISIYLFGLFWLTIVNIVLSVFASSLIIYYWGLSRNEKKYIVSFVRLKLFKKV